MESPSKWTRSSPSGADPLDPGRAGFAHRGLHSGPGFPENSFPAFAAALELGAGIECDLRLTKDNRIVAFHDSDALRMCGSPLRIGRTNWAELSGLRVGEHPIPTLRGLLDLVDGRVPLLLEVKADRDLRRWLPALKRDLEGYRAPHGIMSFDPRLGRLLKKGMPGVRRGLVVRDDLPALRRRASLWLARPDFIAVDRTALGKAWVAGARRRMPIYAWTIRTEADRAKAEVQADALIWEADGRPRI